jgi:hypothetical protein
MSVAQVSVHVCYAAVFRLLHLRNLFLHQSFQTMHNVIKFFRDKEGPMKHKQSYIMAIDQGTTSTRAMIFDRKGEVASSAQEEIKAYYPKPGWVEQDANEIWLSVLGVMASALLKGDIAPGSDTRHRHYQSKGNNCGLGPAYRPARASRNRMAIASNRGYLSGAGQGGT